MTNKSKTKKRKKRKKRSIKDIISSEKTLLIVFCLLVLLVAVLFGLVLKKHHEEQENPNANIVIPIYKEFTNYHFSISALGLSQNKDYLFKITNYRNKKVNKEDVDYEIKIENNTKSEIKITRNKKKENLMTNKKESVIDGNFTSNKKEEDTYRVSMISHKKLKDNDFIRVEISNKNMPREDA